LLLAAGERFGAAWEEIGYVEEIGEFAGAIGTFGGGSAAEFGAESDVFGDGELREEGRVLEGHADAAILRFAMSDVFGAEDDFAVVGLIETGDEAEESGFAGAGRAEDSEEFASMGGESELIEGGDGGVGSAEGFGEVLKLEGGHWWSLVGRSLVLRN
jgi:hypothetical protein